MIGSWGHDIECAKQYDRDFYNLPHHWDDAQGERQISPPIGCSSPKCGTVPVVYVISYHYVTGRRGRIGVNCKCVCEKHGRKFAAKHGLEVPDPAVFEAEENRPYLTADGAWDGNVRYLREVPPAAMEAMSSAHADG
jgi:hypothetical protein